MERKNDTSRRVRFIFWVSLLVGIGLVAWRMQAIADRGWSNYVDRIPINDALIGNQYQCPQGPHCQKIAADLIKAFKKANADCSFWQPSACEAKDGIAALLDKYKLVK
jgi:hypothetical protein